MILGGSAEARELADRLSGEPGYHIVSSLAGRVRNPRMPAGAVRVGGFGGADGLRDWLQDNAVGAMIVATHPFAVRITGNAALAGAALDLPTVVLRRPPWQPQPGDHWTAVGSHRAAADAVASADRVFLTIGRQGVAEFADATGPWFLIRCIDPPAGPLPPQHELLLERGPFTVEHDAELISKYRIDVVVSKNSGGDEAAAKLTAARDAGLPVVMIDRPQVPAGPDVVDSVPATLAWLAAVAGGRNRSPVEGRAEC